MGFGRLGRRQAAGGAGELEARVSSQTWDEERRRRGWSCTVAACIAKTVAQPAGWQLSDAAAEPIRTTTADGINASIREEHESRAAQLRRVGHQCAREIKSQAGRSIGGDAESTPAGRKRERQRRGWVRHASRRRIGLLR